MIRERHSSATGFVPVVGTVRRIRFVPAEELRQRLVDGKIYAADKVPSALANFFTAENLTTLRDGSGRSERPRGENPRGRSL